MSSNVDVGRIETVALGDEQLRVAITPGPGVPLVICNNFAANLEVLDDFVSVLGRPTICFDLPGVGGSAPGVQLRHMAGLARLFVRLLDQLDITEPVDLLGIGWGGLLAQRIARDRPQRVRCLVLAATSSGPLMFPGRLVNLGRLTRPESLTRVARTARQARTVFGGRRIDECESVSRAMKRANAPSPRGFIGQVFAMAGFTSLRWLHRLMLPTLILAGDDDPLVPVVNARIMAALIPRARLKVIRGGGHWFVLERPAEVAALLDQFLGRANSSHD